MRIIILFFINFLLFFGVKTSFGQVSVRIFDYRPTGELGFVMKPLLSVEAGFMQEFDKRIRSSFSITFLKMKPRMESFPVYGVLTDGNGTTVLPGEQSFKKYSLFQLFCGFDFAFIKTKKLFIYMGADIIVGAANVDYIYKIETYKDESYSGGGILGGFRFRLGAEYAINEKLGLIINANRNLYLVAEPAAIFLANDYGIGMRYSFN